jgi:hypothetical protein
MDIQRGSQVATARIHRMTALTMNPNREFGRLIFVSSSEKLWTRDDPGDRYRDEHPTGKIYNVNILIEQSSTPDDRKALIDAFARLSRWYAHLEEICR